MRKARVGAVLWIFCLQYFVAEAITIRGWRGLYSFSENYISDLGATRCGVHARGLTGIAANLCSPLHDIMNGSLILQGLLIIFGTLLTWPLFPSGRLWTTAKLLIGVSGLGVLLVGVAPEDLLPKAHLLGAAENFICCNLGMAAMGVAMLRWQCAGRAMALITLVAGLTGLLALGLLATNTYLDLGVGGMERVAAYPFPVWIAGLGALLSRRGGLSNARA